MSWRRQRNDDDSASSSRTIKEQIIPLKDPESLKQIKQEKLQELRQKVNRVNAPVEPGDKVKIEKEDFKIDNYTFTVKEDGVPHLPNDTRIPIDREIFESEDAFDESDQDEKPKKKRKGRKKREEEYDSEDEKEHGLDFTKKKDRKIGVNSMFRFQAASMLVLDVALTKFKLHDQQTLTKEFLEQRKLYEGIYEDIIIEYGDSMDDYKEYLDPITVWGFTTLATIGAHLMPGVFAASDDEKVEEKENEKIIENPPEVKIREVPFEY